MALASFQDKQRQNLYMGYQIEKMKKSSMDHSRKRYMMKTMINDMGVKSTCEGSSKPSSIQDSKE